MNACGKYLDGREKWAIERLCSLIWRWLMTFWVWASYRILMSKMRFCKSCLIKNSSEYVQSSPELCRWPWFSTPTPFIISGPVLKSFDSVLFVGYHETVEYIPSPPWGEMRMYSLKSRYYGPYLLLIDASHDISHGYLYLVKRFPLHHVYIC